MNKWLKRGLIFLAVLLAAVTLTTGIGYWLFWRAPKIESTVHLPQELELSFFLPSGKKIVGIDSKNLNLFDAQIGVLQKTIEPPSFSKLAFSKDWSKIVGTPKDQFSVFFGSSSTLSPTIFDIETQTYRSLASPLTSNESKTSMIRLFFINHDNRVVALYDDYTKLVWDARSGELLDKSSIAFLKPILQLSVCIEEWHALESKENSLPRDVFLEKCALRKNYELFSPIMSFDGTKILFGNLIDDQIDVWDLNNAKKICSLPKSLVPLSSIKKTTNSFSFSLDDSHLLVTQENPTITLSWFRTNDCKLEQTLDSFSLEPKSIFPLPNQNIFFFRKITDSFVWNPKTNQIFFPFQSGFLPQGLSWLENKLPDWLRSKEIREKNPIIRSISIDPERKQLQMDTENGILTWSLGKYQNLFF